MITVIMHSLCFTSSCNVHITFGIILHFFAFINTLDLNYTVTYAPRDFRDVPQVDCLPDSIILLA